MSISSAMFPDFGAATGSRKILGSRRLFQKLNSYSLPLVDIIVSLVIPAVLLSGISEIFAVADCVTTVRG